jgi:hypothetical protein
MNPGERRLPDRLATGLRMIRRGQLALLLESVAPPALLHRDDLLIIGMRRVLPLSRSSDRITVRWAGPEDVPRLETIRPRPPRESRLRGGLGYARRFESGWRCVIGELDGEPASMSWLIFGDWHESAMSGFTFRLGPSACWLTDMFVRPAFRGTSVFHTHWVEAMALLAGVGIDAWYSAVEAGNDRARRSFLRIGCEVLYRYRMLRLAGLIHHSARPAEGLDAPSSRGWVRWVGSDPRAAVPPAAGPAPGPGSRGRGGGAA